MYLLLVFSCSIYRVKLNCFIAFGMRVFFLLMRALARYAPNLGFFLSLDALSLLETCAVVYVICFWEWVKLFALTKQIEPRGYPLTFTTFSENQRVPPDPTNQEPIPNRGKKTLRAHWRAPLPGGACALCALSEA